VSRRKFSVHSGILMNSAVTFQWFYGSKGQWPLKIGRFSTNQAPKLTAANHKITDRVALFGEVDEHPAVGEVTRKNLNCSQ